MRIIKNFGFYLKYFVKRLITKAIHIFRIFTAPIRTQPDFIIIGACKAGTTSLYKYLTKHPSIFPAFDKEPQFFDNNYKKGKLWYKSFFPSIILKYFINKFTSRSFITGEASPYYILYPHAPKRIVSMLPHIKIIALLRNPVNRSFSHYHHAVKVGVEWLTFDEAIKKEDIRIKGEFEKICKDEQYMSHKFPAYAYLNRSLYLDQITNWLRYLPKKQILIIKSEDLFNFPQKIVNQIFKFLNLPKWEMIEFKQYHSETRDQKMNTDTRKLLVDYFKPYNQQLYEYLGRDFNWEKE
ncbi:MAG: sulfotransferase domain-containing protein [Promethearchaeota archaeon]